MGLEPTVVINVLASALLLTGVVLFALPIGSCPECDHCRVLRAERRREMEEQAARYYGIPHCAACGRHHDPPEDHPR